MSEIMYDLARDTLLDKQVQLDTLDGLISLTEEKLKNLKSARDSIVEDIKGLEDYLSTHD